jgi:hypothetical protein
MNFKLQTSNFRNIIQIINIIVICFLVLNLEVGGLKFGFLSSPGLAMGAKPPAKEEPKYKLEILKMEIIPAYEITSEIKVPAKSSKKVAK